MGILNKISQSIFKDKNKRNGSDFDLKELQENLRIHRQREAEKKKLTDQITEEIQHETKKGTSKIIREVTLKPDSLKSRTSYENKPVEKRQLSNPLLLGVKMFLAEVPYIIKGYYDLDRNNCQNFAKDVQNAATKRGIRCGVVIIGFKENPTGHAIVSFDTDHGLKFFEPQSADEEDVIIGRRYTASLPGVSDDDIIVKAEITWNDGAHTVIEPHITSSR
jgi:hypothetical protein